MVSEENEQQPEASADAPETRTQSAERQANRKQPTWSHPVTTGAYSQPSQDITRANNNTQSGPITTGQFSTEPVADGQSTTSKSFEESSAEDADKGTAKSASVEALPTSVPASESRSQHGGVSGSGGSGAQGTEGSEPPRRRPYKRRVPREASTPEDLESRKQRRLAKNRVTAAVSRERKRAQLADLQERVRVLEEDNSSLSQANTDLNQALEEREQELKATREELASLNKGASGDLPLAARATESAEHGEIALPLAHLGQHGDRPTSRLYLSPAHISTQCLASLSCLIVQITWWLMATLLTGTQGSAAAAPACPTTCPTQNPPRNPLLAALGATQTTSPGRTSQTQGSNHRASVCLISTGHATSHRTSGASSLSLSLPRSSTSTWTWMSLSCPWNKEPWSWGTRRECPCLGLKPMDTLANSLVV